MKRGQTFFHSLYSPFALLEDFLIFFRFVDDSLSATFCSQCVSALKCSIFSAFSCFKCSCGATTRYFQYFGITSPLTLFGFGKPCFNLSNNSIDFAFDQLCNELSFDGRDKLILCALWAFQGP